MTKTTSSLETFDFLELLYALSEQGRSGLLGVYRPDGQFQAWLRSGRVAHLSFGETQGTSALVALMEDPRGRFHFEEGVEHPDPRLDASLDEVALEAMDAIGGRELTFGGPARLTDRARVSALRWSLREEDILQQIDKQRPVADISREPDAKRLLEKLYRIGLITSRKSRVARLTIVVTRQVQGVAVVDDLIFRRWKEDIIRHPQQIAVRTDDGQVYTLPVRSSPDLSAQLLVPAELLVRTGLHAGDSVLVRPL